MRARVGVRVEVRVGVRIRGFAGEGDHDLQRLFVEVPLRAMVRYKSGELGTVCLVVLPPRYGPFTVQWEAEPTAVRRLRRRREILHWGAC